MLLDLIGRFCTWGLSDGLLAMSLDTPVRNEKRNYKGRQSKEKR
jgi:hypothetical protein